MGKTESFTDLKDKKGQIIRFFSVEFSRHFVLLVPVTLVSCCELVVALHAAFCFKDTDIKSDMDDLKEGKISTIFFNEFASFRFHCKLSLAKY